MEELIKRYDLAPHPEGGYFKEIYRSDLKLISPETCTQRHAVTQIYFMLTAGQVSRFHRYLSPYRRFFSYIQAIGCHPYF